MQEGNTPSPGEQPQDIHHVKDKFARKMFGIKELTISFLEEFMPELNPSRDWSGLQEEPGSFISEEFRSKYSDILFSFQGEPNQALVYILIEHKSAQEYRTLFYLFQIMMQIWDKRLDEQGQGKIFLPVIIPIILHQSTGKWTAPTNFEEYFGPQEKLRQHIPKFSAKVVDLSEINVEEIEEAFLKTVLSLMKVILRGQPKEWLEKHQRELSEIVLKRYGKGLLAFMLRYLGQSDTPISVSTIQAVAGKFPDENLKNEVMTWNEQFKQEGRLEGQLEGRMEGQRKGLLMGQIINQRENLGLPTFNGADLEDMSIPELQGEIERLRKAARNQ